MDLPRPKNVFTLSRDIFDHSYVGAGNGGRDPWTRLEAWAWLIARANYRPSEIDIRGEIVVLGRAQLVVTLGSLSERWKWSVKQVRTFLDRIQKLDMIGRKTGTPKGSHQTIVTISNYDVYQFLEDFLGQPKGRPKGNPRATQGQQSNKNNKDNTKRESARAGNSNARPGGADEALVLYNEGARQHGWAVCQGLTAARCKRFEKRLADIGGIDQFALALSAIPNDDFLMGRRPPRDGGKPFRLDLDRLLSTDSNMGDVLARLLDAAMDAQMNGAVHGVEAEVTRVAESTTGKRLIAEKGRSAALAEIRALLLSQVQGGVEYAR